MLNILTLAVPIGLLWVAVTGRISIGSIVVGYLIGVLTLVTLRLLQVRLRASFTPRQAIAFVQYSTWVLWDCLLSSIQVARLILRPQIDLKTGIVALPTGDTSPEQRLTALSAHGINLAPGQLVVDFDDQGTLYLHCLDLESAHMTMEVTQARRARLLRTILGEDRHE